MEPIRLKPSEPGAVLYRVGAFEVKPEYTKLPEGQERLRVMQEKVGGLVERLHLGASRHRRHVVYDGWVNEEGGLLDLPIGLSVRVQHGAIHRVVPVHGSLLVTAGETLSGETVPLLPAEIYDLVFIPVPPHGKLPMVALAPEMSDA